MLCNRCREHLVDRLLDCVTVCLTVTVKVGIIFGYALQRVVCGLNIMTVQNDTMKSHTLCVEVVEKEKRREGRI